jgi:MFS superfamily sulfate permease-like transporter
VFQHHNHPQRYRYSGDLSGAFADLGTFLPIVIAVLTLQQVDPSGLFISFGIFALVVAVVYRRPIPIQPMKVVAAVVITQSLDAQTIAATGFLLGLTILSLTLTGALDLLARKIPTPVLSGIQLGVGLMLAWAGVGLILDQPWIGIISTIALFVLLATPLNPFAAVLVVASACLWTLATQQNTLPEITLGLHMPKWISFGWTQLWSSAQTIILPQLALTLTNAIIATSVIAGHYFPEEKQRINPTRLGVTTGILNIVLAPFGGFPMCHGAGGLVVQHRFGARSWLTPTLFGISMLSLGIVLGEDALKLLLLIPLAAVGALLLYAGFGLAWNKSLANAKPYELIIIGITGLCCPVFNVAIALLIGWLAFVLISKLKTWSN